MSDEIEKRKAPQGVSTLAELAELDDDEILSGYRSAPELPPSTASRSFIHGWMNRMVDLGKFKASAAQMKLAGEYVHRRGR